MPLGLKGITVAEKCFFIFEKSPDGRGKPFNKMMTNGDVTNM